MRKRVVTAGRQILAKDVNDISDFLIDDMKDLCKDVFAISDGVVNGLSQSNSLLTATITAGKVHKNSTGTFFELIADANINLTASATNYVYAVEDATQTSDLPVTGFKLIDTQTRAETYDTVNTRSYDSISIVVNTTGVAPANSYPLWELVTDATSVTSQTDVRTFCTSGNMTAYSLQHFAQTGLNTVTIGTGLSQRMTLELYKSSVADYVGLDIAMVSGFAGKGFNFDLSSNVGSIGGVITTNNNLGLDIINTGNTSKGIKISSSSILTTTTGLDIQKQKNGISLIDNDINIGMILSANQYGLVISEVSSGTTGVVGVNITNVASSINVTNSNTRTSGNLISITATSSSLNGSSFLNTLNGTGLAQAIVLNAGATDTSYGTLYKSTSTAGANVTAIVIGDSAVNITRGIAIEDCVTGIYLNEVDASIDINNTNSSRTGALIDISGAGSVSNPSLINLTQNGKGYAQTTILNSGILANVAYGNYITNTGVANSAVGIDIDGSTVGYNAFHTGLLMSGVTRGIDITVVTGSTNYGSKITGNGITGADGYVATTTRYGLDVGDSAIGARLVNNDIGISITNNINDTALIIDNDHKGIEITNSATSVHYGMKVLGSGITGSDGIIVSATRYGLDSGSNNVGIRLQDNEVGLKIENMASGKKGILIDNNNVNSTTLAMQINGYTVDESLSFTAIELNHVSKGIKIENTTIYNTTIGLNPIKMGYGVYADNCRVGIGVNNSTLIGVAVDGGILAYSSDNADVGLAVTGYTKAFIKADILNAHPTGNATGDMYLYFDSGAGTYNLVLFDGIVHRYLEFI